MSQYLLSTYAVEGEPSRGAGSHSSYPGLPRTSRRCCCYRDRVGLPAARTYRCAAIGTDLFTVRSRVVYVDALPSVLVAIPTTIRVNGSWRI
jgi:hypothetical protein